MFSGITYIEYLCTHRLGKRTYRLRETCVAITDLKDLLPTATADTYMYILDGDKLWCMTITTDGMESTPDILSLPLEILQSIARFVDKTDLPTLRLVSKEVGSATFDIFARRYLSNLLCYVMDPARLQRMKAITSREHLVRKIKKATFCMDPWELRTFKAIKLAPGEVSGVETYKRRDAQRYAHASYVYDQCTFHNQHIPDAALIVSILWDLKVARCPDVALYLCQWYDRGYGFPDLQKSKSITQPILNAFLCSGGPLSGLILEGDDYIKPEFLGTTRTSSVESLGEGLQSFDLETNAWDLVRAVQDMPWEAPNTTDRWMALTMAILAKAHSLRSLRLMVDYFIGPGFQHSSESILSFTTVMLEINPLSRLRKLALEFADCRLKCLLHALARCSKTLQFVGLYHVSIESPGSPWIILFERLLQCSCLETLYLDYINVIGGPMCRMRNPFNSDNDDYQLKVKGKSRISEALKYNVECLKASPSPSPPPLDV